MKPAQPGKKEYFEIKIEELQCLGIWAADCAERALSLFEQRVPGDSRPRAAILGIREFSNTGKRTNHLRKLAMDAYRASLETKDPAASAAAQSASFAASSAYTHPFKDINQSKHILGAAVYASFSLEQDKKEGQSIGDQEIETAIATAASEIANLLSNMPAYEPGSSRIDQLFYELDRGIRNKFKEVSDH